MSKENFASYADSSEWADIQPVYSSEAETAILKITCTARFSEVFAYFRALTNKAEVSDRALLLTEDAIYLNPANYSVWYYRRFLLKELGRDYREELKFCSTMIKETPKNYQLWHHRMVLIETLKDPTDELDFNCSILHEDNKNYHAWQYRCWLVSEFNLWDDELDYSERMICNDVRNNSAWNYRYFVINSTTGFTEAVLDKEMQSCFRWIKLVPNNESAWNYLSGIMVFVTAGGRNVVAEFCKSMQEGPEPIDMPCNALLFLYDYWAEKFEDEKEMSDKESAVEVCNKLKTIDPMRNNYYTFMKSAVEQS
uniref:Protein farnesyltransferase/geranylgeranyltransferase type-1 subunit alpha n=1 Tax=Trichuris muris TaxID=70415 RepID=A0A5S6QMI2_TRIMR